MFLTCYDFVNAGVVDHDVCCDKCHGEADYRYRPLVDEYYRGVTINCCCGFAGKRFSAEEMERVLQGKGQ